MENWTIIEDFLWLYLTQRNNFCKTRDEFSNKIVGGIFEFCRSVALLPLIPHGQVDIYCMKNLEEDSCFSPWSAYVLPNLPSIRVMVECQILNVGSTSRSPEKFGTAHLWWLEASCQNIALMGWSEYLTFFLYDKDLFTIQESSLATERGVIWGSTSLIWMLSTKWSASFQCLRLKKQIKFI